MKNIAILGPENTFSDEACKIYEQLTGNILQHQYYKTITETMMAVNESTWGILPIENTLEGFVQQHMDLLIEFDLSIDSEIDLPISFSFISHVPIEQMSKIYVQYSARNQCQTFLRTHPSVITSICDSNTESYHQYLEDSKSSAIIPRHIFDSADVAYGIKDITDEETNTTRFLIVKKANDFIKHHYNYEKFKVTIAILPEIDRPGLLFDILKVFALHQINLLSIMSRPTKKQIGKYRFFIDLEVDKASLSLIHSVLQKLNDSYQIKLLGIYPKLSK